tara:strand:- start:6884 stop:8428 length:1545 start_codon:yes stop_codon:yes gene_type:complete
MSIRNSKTANALELSDPLTKLQLEKDDLFDLFVEDESELKEGDYEGEILAMQRVPGTRFYKAMVRIPQLHDSQIPTAVCQDDPTRSPKFSNAQQKLLIYNHICAISEIPMGDIDSDPDVVAPDEADDAIFCQKFISTKVLVRFRQSPNQKGKTRFAKFRIPQLTSQLSSNSNGCYNMDCTEDLGLDGFFGFGSGDDFLYDEAGNTGGTGGNPRKSTKLRKVKKRTKKGKLIDFPIAFTVAPWTGELYEDIKKCPFKSHKNLNYFGTETPSKESGIAGKANLGGGKSTLLGREFMKLLASKLTFDIKMTSNFRGPTKNANIMANTTFEHMATPSSGGLNKYNNTKNTYTSLYKRAKEATGESDPKKGGPTYKIVLSEIKKMFNNKKTGHSVGGAVDISSRILNRQQVSDVMYTCYYMGVNWVMLEHHIPHIHVTITKDQKTFSKPADYNNSAKVKALLDKFNKSYKKKAPPILPNTPNSQGGSTNNAGVSNTGESASAADDPFMLNQTSTTEGGY